MPPCHPYRQGFHDFPPARATQRVDPRQHAPVRFEARATPCGLPPSGTRLNHRTKVTFNRIDFDQDVRYLPETSGPNRRDRRARERVTFFNPESGFAVLRVYVRGQREPMTILGSLPSVSAGEWLTAEGWWVRDKEHGLQFKAKILKTIPPTTRGGVVLVRFKGTEPRARTRDC
jgi:hypothetical protein